MRRWRRRAGARRVQCRCRAGRLRRHRPAAAEPGHGRGRGPLRRGDELRRSASRPAAAAATAGAWTDRPAAGSTTRCSPIRATRCPGATVPPSAIRSPPRPTAARRTGSPIYGIVPPQTGIDAGEYDDSLAGDPHLLSRGIVGCAGGLRAVPPGRLAWRYPPQIDRDPRTRAEETMRRPSRRAIGRSRPSCQRRARRRPSTPVRPRQARGTLHGHRPGGRRLLRPVSARAAGATVAAACPPASAPLAVATEARQRPTRHAAPPQSTRRAAGDVRYVTLIY